jgi:hypothetical protein
VQDRGCSCVDFFEKSEKPFDVGFVLGVLEFLEMLLYSGSDHEKLLSYASDSSKPILINASLKRIYQVKED